MARSESYPVWIEAKGNESSPGSRGCLDLKFPGKMCGQVQQRERWQMDYDSLSSSSDPGRARNKAKTGSPRQEDLLCHFWKMKTTHTKCRKKQLAPKESWDSSLFIMYSIGKVDCLEHTHSLILDLLSPRWFHSRLWALKPQGTKAETAWYLEAGKLKEQKHCYSSLGRDFQPGYVVVFWSSVVKWATTQRR